MRRDFQRLAPKPHFLGRIEHRTMSQAFDQLSKRDHKTLRRRCNGFSRFSLRHRAHQRMQIVSMTTEMFSEKRRRKFNCDEAMLLARAARCNQRRLSLKVKREHSRQQINRLLSIGQFSTALQIQAQLNAAGMKTSRPIKLLFRRELVPLEAEPQVLIVAKQRPPARADSIPCRRFRKRSLAE